MNLKHLKDSELLSQTKALVHSERLLLTKVLHHLREVERRRLFSDLGYQSLFEYAVKELKYSEGQAGRRIQAMRLLKELPEIEGKIASGALSLSNISQAQSYFRSVQKKSASQQISIDLNSTQADSFICKDGTALNIGTSRLNKDSTASTSSVSNSKSCFLEEGKCQFNESSKFTQTEGLFHSNYSSQGPQASTPVNTANTQVPNKKINHLSGMADESVTKSEKLRLLERLENKSARDGQKLILSMQPEVLPIKERERILSDDKTEVKFVITAELKAKLAELRALLGTKGATMSFSELISYMADISIQETKIQKFGKKRVLGATGTKKMNSVFNKQPELNANDGVKDLDRPVDLTPKITTEDVNNQNTLEDGNSKSRSARQVSLNCKSAGPTERSAAPTLELSHKMEGASGQSKRSLPSASEVIVPKSEVTSQTHTLATPTSELLCSSGRAHYRSQRNVSKDSRYISKSLRFEVWTRDGGQCTQCGSQKHLNIDHIKPVALGGKSTLCNLRLLCFHCNQRQALKTFGDCTINQAKSRVMNQLRL